MKTSLILLFLIVCFFGASESKTITLKTYFVQRFAKCAITKCKKLKGAVKLNCQQGCFKSVKLSTCLRSCHTSKSKQIRIKCRKTCFNTSTTKATKAQGKRFINYLTKRRTFLLKKHKKFLKLLKKKRKVIMAEKKKMLEKMFKKTSRMCRFKNFMFKKILFLWK